MLEAFVVGLILAALWAAEKLFGTPMVIRPIVVSPLVGLALGNLELGLLVGATLELVFMGAMQIGGAVPPDVLVGSGLGTSFAILSNQGPEIALGLALPIAVLAQSLKVVVFILRSYFMQYAVTFAKNADIKKMHALNLFGLLIQCFMYFAVAFLAITFGSAAVSEFVSKVPETMLRGLGVAGGLLPAVGFALLLLPMLTAKNIFYFIFGFTLVAYLKLPIMAIAVIAVCIAYFIMFEKSPSAAKKEEEIFDV